MTSVAVQRESVKPHKAKKKKGAAEPETVPQGWTDVLISAIPTEVLAIYTTIIGGIVAAIETGGDEYFWLRWSLYAGFAVLVVAWLVAGYFRETTPSARKRRFPVLETVSAAWAFATWGLVMPGAPLSLSLGKTDRIVWTLVITGVGVVILGLLSGQLTSKVKGT
jgi:hypothetical protein